MPHPAPLATLYTPPAGYHRIRVVHSFAELVDTPFTDDPDADPHGVNALCWARSLPGDFAEIARLLHPRVTDTDGILTLDADTLHALPLSDAGRVARDQLLADQQLLIDHDLQPKLDAVRHAPRDLRGGPIATDVYSWHADSATAEADSFLCTYHGLPSEALRNDQAVRKVDLPHIRAALLALHGGPDDPAFLEFLEDHYYDLHYAPLPAAEPLTFGLHHLWRIAIACPDSPVPPCIHRAPLSPADAPPRLLLIS